MTEGLSGTHSGNVSPISFDDFGRHGDFKSADKEEPVMSMSSMPTAVSCVVCVWACNFCWDFFCTVYFLLKLSVVGTYIIM